MDNNRINVVFGIVVFIGLLLVGRLFTIQVMNYEAYAREAESQYSTAPINIFERGDINFLTKERNEISAATLKSGYTIFIKPSLISNPDELYENITTVIDLDREKFFRSANKVDDPYEEIAWRVSRENRDKILEVSDKSVGSVSTQWRYYPGEETASQVLGFVGFNGDVLEGRYGVERRYEENLNRDSVDIYSNFFADVFSNIKKTLSEDEKKDGDIILTIEPDVQKYIESVAKDLVELWQAEVAGIIVIEPDTGAIRAMGTYPSYNPNKYNEVSDIAIFQNPMVEKVYEMGSIMKPITLSAGIDSGSIKPTTTYKDEGSVILNGETLSNFDGQGRGVVDMQEVMNKSLNTGTVFMVSKMGNHVFRDYVYAFGLNEKTGIDLPNEVVGLTDNLLSERDVEYATASFGQGIAVTPIEMTRAVSAIANGGYLIKPYVVDEIKYRYALNEKREPIEQGRVIQRSTSETVTRMLVEVVDEAYQSGNAKLPHYSIAAKTGTAQMAKPGGGYYDDRRLHSFFGYFPAYDPEFLVFIYLENPRGVKYSSQTLINPFMDTAKFLINHYDIPPDR